MLDIGAVRGQLARTSLEGLVIIECFRYGTYAATDDHTSCNLLMQAHSARLLIEAIDFFCRMGSCNSAPPPPWYDESEHLDV